MPGYAPQSQVPDEVFQKQEQTRKRRERDHAQSQSAVNWMIALLLFSNIMLILSIFGKKWYETGFHGPGVQIFEIELSMFDITVNVRCGKNIAEKYICDKVVSHWSGTQTLAQAQSDVCAVNLQALGLLTNLACQIMRGTYLWSFSVIIGFTFAAMFGILGTLFLFFYWYVSPHPKIRQTAQFFLVAGPIAGTIGLALWSFMKPNLGTLPNSWLMLTNALRVDNVLGFTETPGWFFSWGWFFATLWLTINYLTLVIWPTMIKNHQDESNVEEEERRQREYMAQYEYSEIETQPLANSAVPMYATAPPETQPMMGAPAYNAPAMEQLNPQPMMMGPPTIQPAMEAPTYTGPA